MQYVVYNCRQHARYVGNPHGMGQGGFGRKREEGGGATVPCTVYTVQYNQVIIFSVFKFVYSLSLMAMVCLSISLHQLQYSTVQYSTVRHSTVQYSTVEYMIVMYSTVKMDHEFT